MYSPGNYSGNSHWNGDDTVVSTAFQIEFCVTHIDRSVDVVGKLYAQQKVLEISFRMGFRLNAFVAKGTLGNSEFEGIVYPCLLYTSPSPRDRTRSRMPSSA